MGDKLFLLRLILGLLLLCFGTQSQSQSQSGEEDDGIATEEITVQEVQALLAFKESADIGQVLSSWKPGGNPCKEHWNGVSCVKGHVFRLVLEGSSLSGSIDPLLGLRFLRLLSLKNNALNGTLPPDLSSWRNLKFLFLGGNDLSGSIPRSLAVLTHLWRLDLSRNRFTGPIPPWFDGIPNLLTLRLEGNAFSQSLPQSLGNLPSLVDFNVSYNQLQGIIPKRLASRFNASAFAGNPHLCGFPLSARCNIAPAQAPSSSSNFTSSIPGIVTVPSTRYPPDGSSSSSSSNSSSSLSSGNKKKSSNKLSTGAIIAIVVGDTVVLLVMTFMFLIYYWNKYTRQQQQEKQNQDCRSLEIGGKSGKKLHSDDQDQLVDESHYHMHRASGASVVSIVSAANNKLVFLDHQNSGGSSSGKRFRGFDLEDLLRASAEMLGKGSLGSAYKAMLEDGHVVAVKRLKDVTSSSRKDFEQHMELIGRMRHPHLVLLRAYYYAKDEKLLVYDYMPNGSLHTLLHGNRGPGRVPVDWTTRMKIALGAARGLAYIHQQSGSHKIPHGNIKSTNILLGKNGDACVADFGLALLMNSAACSRLQGYRAPEHSETRKISQKGDVYSFGVLLLEILTGKPPAPVPVQQQHQGGGVVDLPRWVQSVVREEWTAEVFDLELMRYKNIEEEMVGLLQIAMACVAHSPDARPKMSHVVKLIQDIRRGGEQSSPALPDESFDSQSQSSSLSEDGTSH